jgi:selenocysteine lyase/cysteine desulfurase
MMSSLNTDKIREETEGCFNVIHFGAAGASLMPDVVTRRLIKHVKLEAQIGGYEAAAETKEESEAVYEKVATLLGCDASEIALSDNATRSWSLLFYSLKFTADDVILTSVAEYGSNYIPFLQVAKQTGCKVMVVPNDEHGQLDVHALSTYVTDTYKGQVKLIAVTHIPTNGGLVNPAAAIGAVAKEHDIYYLLDACQSVGQVPLDVKAIGCDFLSGTSRKYLRGPRGIGFLYVNKRVCEQIEPVFLDIHSATWGGSASYAPKDSQGTAAVAVKVLPSSLDSSSYYVRTDARRFETWETSIASQLAFGTAVEYAIDLGIDNIYADITALATWLRGELASIPGVVVADLGKEKCGIVTWYVSLDQLTEQHGEGRCDEAAFERVLAPAAIKAALCSNPKRINVTVTGATSTLLDAQQRELPELVRSSVSYYNTREECEQMLVVLRGLVAQYTSTL